jgi:hypothetical protein
MTASETPAPSLGELSLRIGDRVRFRRSSGQRWQEAVVEGRERDGSIALRDSKGASRSIRVELVEVYRSERGSSRWEQVEERPWEQLDLFAEGPSKRRTRRRTTGDTT